MMASDPRFSPNNVASITNAHTHARTIGFGTHARVTDEQDRRGCFFFFFFFAISRGPES